MCWTGSCASEGVNCVLPSRFKLDHDFPFGSCSFLLSPSLSSFVHENACDPHHSCAAKGIKPAAARGVPAWIGACSWAIPCACAPEAHPELGSLTAEPSVLRGVG